MSAKCQLAGSELLDTAADIGCDSVDIGCAETGANVVADVDAGADVGGHAGCGGGEVLGTEAGCGDDSVSKCGVAL